MAKPIAPTPDFEGEAAEKLIREMLEPPLEKDKKLVEEMKKQRLVAMFSLFFSNFFNIFLKRK